MSPLPAPGRKALPLLGIALLVAFVAVPALAQDTNTTPDGTNTTPGDTNATTGDDNATPGEGNGTAPPAGGGSGGDLGVPADAPAPAEGAITRVLTVGVIEEGGTCPGGLTPPCFDVLTFAANPGDVVVLHGDFRNSANIHNLHATEGVESAPQTRLAPNALHTISFPVGEERVRVICDAHAQTMILDIVDPITAGAGGAHGTSIPALGVHFLAYWVGVIAFAILFIVYGITFFLFKYNETPATTDHWDRTEGAGGSRRLAAVAPLLAVALAVVVIGAIIYIATTR